MVQCPNGCDTPMRRETLKKIFDTSGKSIVVDNLQMNVCPTCGQESMPASTGRAVENILNGKAQPIGQFNAQLYSAAG